MLPRAGGRLCILGAQTWAATDLYFPPEDSEFEVAHMPNAELRVISSVWKHFAGGPGTSPDDVKFMDEALQELLAS